jgi:hypothetical protein
MNLDSEVWNTQQTCLQAAKKVKVKVSITSWRRERSVNSVNIQFQMVLISSLYRKLHTPTALTSEGSHEGRQRARGRAGLIRRVLSSGSPLKVNRRFGGTYRLHIHGRRISRERNQREIRCQAELSLSPVPPKRRLAFNGLHDIISQNIVLFITAAVRISNSAGLRRVLHVVKKQIPFSQIVVQFISLLLCRLCSHGSCFSAER